MRAEIGHRFHSKKDCSKPRVRREAIMAIRGGGRGAEKRAPSLPKLKCLEQDDDSTAARE